MGGGGGGGGGGRGREGTKTEAWPPIFPPSTLAWPYSPWLFLGPLFTLPLAPLPSPLPLPQKERGLGGRGEGRGEREQVEGREGGEREAELKTTAGPWPFSMQNCQMANHFPKVV